MLKREKYFLKDLPRLFINKSLEKHGVDYDYILENQKQILEDTGKEWYQIYTFDTEKEFDEWKSFCIEILTKRLKPYRFSKKRAIQEFAMFNLSFGLSQNYLKDESV